MFHVIFIVISIFAFDVDLDRPVHLFFVRWLIPQLLNAHPHVNLPLGRGLQTIRNFYFYLHFHFEACLAASVQVIITSGHRIFLTSS